jgi:hypothetical protein
LALVAAALLVYALAIPDRFYDHFEWQASALLEGQPAIRYPVEATPTDPGNAFFQDVLPVPSSDGVPRALIPFPPLPAVALMPFVALWGLATDGQQVFAILAAIDVGLAWWVLGRLPVRRWVRLTTTIFLGFGTVLWYAAHIGTTWFQAHVLAVGLTLVAIGIAIGADRDSAFDEDHLPFEPDVAPASEPTGRADRFVAAARRGVDPRQFLAGLLFGLACTSRLTIAFGAPFFLLVGPGGSWRRRGVSAGLGAAIPLVGLLAFNLWASGSLFHPAYDHLYRLEAAFYEPLNYHAAWSIEDPRYIPQNLAIMFLSLPVFSPDVVPMALGNGARLCTEPGAVRSLLDPGCPIVLPRDIGMSVLLTSPAYLLALPSLRLYGRSRLVTGAVLASLAIVVVNLMHFSQGWVQFGYRFSNDVAPFAIILVALGLERLAARAPGARRTLVLGGALALVLASVAVNAWGVYWGSALGW